MVTEDLALTANKRIITYLLAAGYIEVSKEKFYELAEMRQQSGLDMVRSAVAGN